MFGVRVLAHLEFRDDEAATGQYHYIAGVSARVGDDERPQGASGFAPVGGVVGSRDNQGEGSVKPTTTTDKAPAPLCHHPHPRPSLVPITPEPMRVGVVAQRTERRVGSTANVSLTVGISSNTTSTVLPVSPGVNI